MEKYDAADDEEDDAILHEVLGIPRLTPHAPVKRTGGKPPKKAARLDIFGDLSPSAPRTSKRDAMDEILAKHEADERYSAKLAHALDQITTETDHEAAPSAPRSKTRFLSLDANEEDDFHHETTYLVPYFASTVIPGLEATLAPVQFQAVSKPRRGASASLVNTPENQELFNRFCSQHNAILKLPLLRAYLKRKICPENVADWLIQIMCRSKSAETAFEAYDVLLTLLPVPATGWCARIGKAGQVSVQGRSSTRNALPFVLDYPKIRGWLQMFGAGAKAELIKGNAERALYEASPLSVSRRRGLNPDEFFAELDAQTVAFSEEANAATVAAEYRKLEEMHSSRSFNAYNFSLLVLFMAACTHCELLKATNEELVQLIVSVYRAIVDPATQSVLADLQTLLIALLQCLSSQTKNGSFPKVTLDLCEALWKEFPVASQRQFHATLYRWVYVTPCGTPMLRSVRSAMAFVFLQKQNDLTETLIPSSAAPLPALNVIFAEDKKYTSGKAMVTLAQVVTLIGLMKVPGTATADEWSMYADWVLLIDIASACFNASDIANLKRPLAHWQSTFSLFHNKAKERGDFNLARTRFKDLATHSAAVLNIMANSVVSAKADPMKAYFTATISEAAAKATASMTSKATSDATETTPAVAQSIATTPGATAKRQPARRGSRRSSPSASPDKALSDATMDQD